MAVRRTQAERREATRKRLLEAAGAVFARKGFEGASVLDIVEDAGCSTGALYAHFAGKNDLFLALFDEELASWVVDYETAVHASASVDEALAAATTRWRELLDTKPSQALLLIEFWTAAMRDPKLRNAFVERHARIRDTIGSLVASLIRSQGGRSHLSGRAWGSVITALADGLAMQRLIAPESVPEGLFLDTLRLLFGAVFDIRGATSKAVSQPAKSSRSKPRRERR